MTDRHFALLLILATAATPLLYHEATRAAHAISAWMDRSIAEAFDGAGVRYGGRRS